MEKIFNPDYALLVFVGAAFLGSIGKIDLEVLRSFGIKNEVYYFELNFDAICELNTGLRSFSILPVYPSVKRDISLVPVQSVSAVELSVTVQNRREKVEKGYKSVAV